jgi:DNA-binding XRE family transcriptional regulator
MTVTLRLAAIMAVDVRLFPPDGRGARPRRRSAGIETRRGAWPTDAAFANGSGQMSITPGQVKAARRLLGWSQADLAGHVGVSATSIWAFESGKPRSSTLDLSLFCSALEAAGVEFTAIGSAPAVRLRKAVT